MQNIVHQLHLFLNHEVLLSYSHLLYSSPEWTIATCFTWGCLWRVYGSLSWYKIQQYGQLCVILEKHMLHLFFLSCIGYQFVSRSYSSCYFWPTWQKSELSEGLPLLDYIYPSHQVQQKRHAFSTIAPTLWNIVLR